MMGGTPAKFLLADCKRKRYREMQFGGNRFNRGGFAPVKVGEELDVNIEAVGEKGDGVAKKKGFVIFIPGVQQGDNVRIRITKVFRKMAFAEVVGEATGPVESDEQESAAEQSFGDEQFSDEETPAEEEQQSPEDSEEF